MAITREVKEQQLADLVAKFGTSQLSVLCDYRGLSVAQMQELRAALKDQSSGFKVVKKTLILKALANSKLLPDSSQLDMEGQLGMAFGFEDEVTVTQVLAKFAKDNPALEIKAAINSEGQVLSAGEVKHLATLPSKDQLLGQLVGTIAGPISGLVRVLDANVSGLVRIFNQLKEQKA